MIGENEQRKNKEGETMPKDKVEVTLELERDQIEWLETIVNQFSLSSNSKAARILFDYAISDADNALVFAGENSRCHRCG